MNRYLLPLLFATILALAGCGLHDPYSRRPQGAGAPRVAGPGSTVGGMFGRTEDGARGVLARYASAWVNWSAATLPRQRGLLSALAGGQLARELRNDAAQAARNKLQEVSRAYSRGRYVGVISEPHGEAIVLTYEEVALLGGRAQGAYHVYLARVASTAHGWRVTRWQPASEG
jgi:hypothetical protein